MFFQRTNTLLASLQEAGIQGALVYKPTNIRYLSGYTGEGLLLIAPGTRAIITDFRYTEQAEHQSPDYTVHMVCTGTPHTAVAHRLLEGTAVRTLAFEEDQVTVAQMRELNETMPGIAFVPMSCRPEKLREIKDAQEVEDIAKACAISCQAFEYMLGVLKPGMPELEARLELETAMYRFGAEKLAFDTILAAGVNGSLPHAIPSTYHMAVGDLVTMDFGARYHGYCADITRTVALGKLSEEKRHIYQTVLNAQLRALDALKPGACCKAVDAVARNLIDEAGYAGRFGHGLGHAVGLDIHESPRLSVNCEALLCPGQVITVEPGVYLPGNAGVRIEDSCLITEDGYRILTPVTKELIIL